MTTLLTWYHVGLAMALPLPAAAFLARRCGFEREWVFAFVLLLEGALGYAAFFVWLFSPGAGLAFDVLAALALAGFWFTDDRSIVRSRRILTTLVLTLGVASLYGTVDALGAGNGPFLTAAERHWNLPGDDLIPKSFADAIAAGADPRRSIGGDWLSSDRPPLQAGLALLQRPFVPAAVWTERSYTIVSMVYQLAWIPALLMTLELLGVSFGRGVVAVALVAATAFTFVNTAFVWPKFLAAAFFLYALAALWRVPSDRASSRLAFAGAMLAFALLSHGGVAFSFAGLALVSASLPRVAGVRATFVAAMLFIAVLQPWSAYRTAYDPPGDRLLKWHLAGVIAPDSRSFPRALEDSYAAIGISGTIANRIANVRMLSGQSGDAFDEAIILPVSVAQAGRARGTEFYFFLAAPAFLWLGLFGFALPGPLGRRFDADAVRMTTLLIASLGVWCLLMFGPATTINHQGSYADNLLLDALLAVGLARFPSWAVAVIAGVAAVTFALMFVVPFASSLLDRGFSTITQIAVACAVLAVAIFVGTRESPVAEPV